METPQKYINNLIEMLKDGDVVFSTKNNIEKFKLEDVKQIAQNSGYIFEEAKNFKMFKIPNSTRKNCYIFYKAS